MKKLTGMKDNFASLENKSLKNLKSIYGGTETNEEWVMNTCEDNCQDTYRYRDGIRIGGGRDLPEKDCKIVSIEP